MAEFKFALNKSELPPGAAKAVQIDDKAIALFNVEGQVYATQNACPHRGGPLGEGDLNGNEVTCPWHGWSFDVKTGLGTHAAAQVSTFPVKVEGERVLVGL